MSLSYFPSIYSVLVYHGYTHANYDPWRVGTRLDIFPTSKQPNKGNLSS